MTFNELIDIRPNVRLADLIQLFLLGYDDKIYIDVRLEGNDELIFEEIRIIDDKLTDYYEKKVVYLEDTCCEHCRFCAVLED